jgi:hypothetical protein
MFNLIGNVYAIGNLGHAAALNVKMGETQRTQRNANSQASPRQHKVRISLILCVLCGSLIPPRNASPFDESMATDDESAGMDQQEEVRRKERGPAGHLRFWFCALAQASLIPY